MAATPAPSRTEGTAARAAGWVAPLCWIAVLLDGFDLVVVGTVVPALQQPEEWALSRRRDDVRHHDRPGRHDDRRAHHRHAHRPRRPAEGADRRGHLLLRPHPRCARSRRTRSCSASCGSSPASASAAACRRRSRWSTSSAAAGRSGRATTTMMTGYHVGAVTTAALAIVVIPNLGWRVDVRPRRAAGARPRAAHAAVPAGVGRLPGRARPPGRGGGGRPAVRPRAGGPGRAGRLARRGDRRRDAEDPVHRGVPAQHRGPSASRRSWACCWSTASTTGCRRSCARPSTSSGDALAFLLVLNVGAIAGSASRGRSPTASAPGPAGIVWFAGAAPLPRPAVDQAARSAAST